MKRLVYLISILSLFLIVGCTHSQQPIPEEPAEENIVDKTPSQDKIIELGEEEKLIVTILPDSGEPSTEEKIIDPAKKETPPLQETVNDKDNDGIPDSNDKCPETPDGYQGDFDGDGKGDVCDPPIWAQHVAGPYGGWGATSGLTMKAFMRTFSIEDISSIKNLAEYQIQPAALGQTGGLAFCPQENMLYFSSRGLHHIRKVDLNTNIVTTVTGSPWGAFGSRNGSPENAMFKFPHGIALSKNCDFLFVADQMNHQIRKVDTRTFFTVPHAGSYLYEAGYEDGEQFLSLFHRPFDITVDEEGTLFIIDQDNTAIRKMDTEGNISTLIKKDALEGNEKLPRILSINSLVVSGDFLYAADSSAHGIWQINKETGEGEMIAGKYGEQGYRYNIPGKEARFGMPFGLAISGNKLYLTDRYYHALFEIDLGDEEKKVLLLVGPEESTTDVGAKDGPFELAKFNSPRNLAIDSEHNILFVNDYDNYSIRKVDLNNKRVTTLAGYTPAFATEGVDIKLKNENGMDARFNFPHDGVWLDDHNMLLAEYGNCLIRKITLNENFGKVIEDDEGNRKFDHRVTVSTFAGNPETCSKKIEEVRFESSSTAEGEIYKPMYLALDDNKHYLYISSLTGVIQRLTLKEGENDPEGNIIIVAGRPEGEKSIDGIGHEASFLALTIKALRFFNEKQEDGSYKPLLYVGEKLVIRTIALDEENFGRVETLYGSQEHRGHVDGIGRNAYFGYVGDILIADRYVGKVLTFKYAEMADYLPSEEVNNFRIYVADYANNAIREINPRTQEVKTVAGCGKMLNQDGIGTEACFYNPLSLAAIEYEDNNDFLYVVSPREPVIRQINLNTLEVTTISGDGQLGARDGFGIEASWDKGYEINYHPKFHRFFFSGIGQNHIRQLAPDLPPAKTQDKKSEIRRINSPLK